MKLFLAEHEDFSPAVMQLLKRYYEVEIGQGGQWELQSILQQCDIFWFRLKYRIDRNVVDEHTRCRYLVTPVTGINHIDLSVCAKYGIEIVCLKGEYAFLREVRATAEMTLGLAIALMRKVIPAQNDVLRGHWRRDLFRGRELYKKRAGIIGYGRLGAIVSDYLLAMGMEVSAYDPYREITDDRVHSYSDMYALLGDSDLVSIHVDLREGSRGFFDARAFQSMREGAYLINTSRGELIDEEALLEALESGQLGGAALDVIAEEHQIDGGHPLIAYARQNSRLLLVPHIGGNTYESFEKTERFIAEKLLSKTNHVHS